MLYISSDKLFIWENFQTLIVEETFSSKMPGDPWPIVCLSIKLNFQRS